MAYDKLVDSAQLDADLTSVANAIRTKGGTSAELEFPADFVTAIGDITTGGNLQTKTGITPTESSQTIEPDTGYDGLDSVQIDAISSSYVGSGITRRSSSDLTASGATVTAPAGYYSSFASKVITSGSAKTPATTITANPSIAVSSSGSITASVSKTQNVTPTVSAGYVSSGTAGAITVSGSNTSQLTTKSAETIHPSTSDQTISSGRYLTGNQTFKAVTTTNLTAANIKNGVTVKVGDTNNAERIASVTGTFTGDGNVTVNPLSVTVNGTYTAPSGIAYSPVTVNVSTGGTSVPKSDVNFYDYDGTVLYSYTAADFLQLSAMPSNPSHTGLVSEGWNWSLSAAQNYVEDYGMLEIGAIYDTTDGGARIYVTIDDPELLTFDLGLFVEGTVYIDWGDSSSVDTVESPDYGNDQFIEHIYSSLGDYLITIIPEPDSYVALGAYDYNYSGLYTLLNWPSSKFPFYCGTDPYEYRSSINGIIKRIEVGSSIVLHSTQSESVFYGWPSLETVIISSRNGDDFFPDYFYMCSSLKHINLPSGFGYSSGFYYAFYGCASLESISLPSGSYPGEEMFYNCNKLPIVTIDYMSTGDTLDCFAVCHGLKKVVLGDCESINSGCFSCCTSLRRIDIPFSCYNISVYSFDYCYSLHDIYIRSQYALVNLESDYIFNYCPADFVIHVPSAYLLDYQEDSNWSNYYSHLVGDL